MRLAQWNLSRGCDWGRCAVGKRARMQLTARAQTPSRSRDSRGRWRCRQTRGAASRILAESVAEIGVNEADCYIRVSNSFPGFLPRSWSGGGYEVGKAEHGCEGAPRDGSVSRSICVLALRRRLRRSPGPERQTPQVSAGDHSGQDAKPAPHRLLLLGGVRRRPTIVRWSPRQLFPSLRFAATHRIAALAVECAQSQRGIRPLIAPRRDAAPYRPSPHRAAQGCGVL